MEASIRFLEEKRKKDRRKYLADHRFDIINSILAVAALIVAIIALFFPWFPSGYQPANIDPGQKGQQDDQQYLGQIF